MALRCLAPPDRPAHPDHHHRCALRHLRCNHRRSWPYSKLNLEIRPRPPQQVE